MTRETAMEVVKLAEGWNTSQTSISKAFGGPRTAEDDVHDERRKTLTEAWRVLREAAS